MICKQTVLRVVDNSGAKSVRCFMIYKKRYGSIGSVIRVSVLSSSPTAKAKKGSVYKAIIVRTKKIFVRKDRSSLSFSSNDVVLVNDKLELIATRVKGVVPKELPASIKTVAEGVI